MRRAGDQAGNAVVRGGSTIDNSAIDQWLRLYLQAWATDASEDIARLFTEDAQYFTTPFRKPISGRSAIVAWWVDQRNSAIRWTFDHEVIAQGAGLQGESLFVVRGVTRYPDGLEEPGIAEIYHNLWLVSLGEDGRATEFVEYWMLED